MRSTALIALGAAALANAQLEDSVLSAVDGKDDKNVWVPAFTPTKLKAPFLEQFTDDWESRWKPSHAKKADSEEDWQYVGNWAVEEPVVFQGIAGDKGLVVKDKAAHHAISSHFTKPIDNKDKTLVVQYEVKLQSFLECGGAYLKLLQENAALGTDEFSNSSPYVIMFGPDKCGSTNKVHFIFRHKNPKTGEYEEKHLDAAPAARISKQSVLYTLIVRPDQTFEILIDGESAKTGSLLENFTPAVNPAKEIDDAADKKPADWIDEAKIVDPEAKKPADWLDSEPDMIPDPEAEKPEDWDDEEDGDWLAPRVSNPKCEEASGCGPWEQPKIKNPAYKGKWSAPRIDNPAYKGVWAPRKIANPDYFEDDTPSNFEPIGAIGFEIWTMQENILFDNIYIGHSEEDAEAFRKETFDVKKPIEQKAEESANPQPEAPKEVKSPLDLVFLDDPVFYIKEKWELFNELFKRNPVEAIKFVPEVPGAIAVGVLALLAILIGLLGGGQGCSQQGASQGECPEG